jgi:hypothetical protein
LWVYWKEDGLTMSKEEGEEVYPGNENDLVIRDGFPALKRLDGKGPLICGDEPLPRCSFASYANALHIHTPEFVLKDCEKVFTARTRDDGAAYSAGCTYFFPSQMTPRCALEGLALLIFQAHVKDLDGMYNPEQSGAEWWTLVMDANKPRKTNGDAKQEDDDQDEDDEVGMHFDADYGLEEQMPNILLHPRVATVTYLSDVGAPTIVLDKHSPPPSDPEKKTLNGDVQRAWLSGPQFGKHVAFDGRLFFPGKVRDTTNGEEVRVSKRPKLENSPPEKRITFLVNIWLNHCPLDAELLDDDICKQMETPWQFLPAGANSVRCDPAYKPPFEWKNPDLSKPDSMEKVPLQASEEDPAGSDEGVICDRFVTISYGPTMENLHAASSKTTEGASVELELGNGVISLLVGDEVEEEAEEENDGDMNNP